jgi:hypothetical protein
MPGWPSNTNRFTTRSDIGTRGSRVVGGGVSVAQGAFGNAMTTSRPFDDGDPRARPDDSWGGSFDNWSNTDPGQITVFAICQA